MTDPQGNDPIIFSGKHWATDVRSVTTSASLAMSFDQITELSLSIADPEFKFLGKRNITLGTLVAFQEQKLRVASIATDNGAGLGGVTLGIRPRSIHDLRMRQGKMVLRNVSPTDWCKHECDAVGANFIGQPSAARKTIARDVPVKNESEMDVPPSSWSTMVRLAGEVGYELFEDAGTIYFGKPSWLLKRATPVRVGWLNSPEEYKTRTIPQCQRAEDTPMGAEINVDVPLERSAEFRLGRAIILSGMPTFSGKYLIDSVSFPVIGTGLCTVHGATPIDPDPQGAQTGAAT